MTPAACPVQSLRTPVTSCENVAAIYTEAMAYPKHNDLHNHGNGGNLNPASSSSPQSLLCCCCCCSHFCRSHISLIICLGLIFLFIFNMTLYSFIFYQAHIEGHGF